jgi:hypothetical protein
MNMTSKRSGLFLSLILVAAAGAFGCELLVTFPETSDAGPDGSLGDDGSTTTDAPEEMAADASDANEDAEDAPNDVTDAPSDAAPDTGSDAPVDSTGDSPVDAPSDAPG